MPLTRAQIRKQSPAPDLSLTIDQRYCTPFSESQGEASTHTAEPKPSNGPSQDGNKTNTPQLAGNEQINTLNEESNAGIDACANKTKTSVSNAELTTEVEENAVTNADGSDVNDSVLDGSDADGSRSDCSDADGSNADGVDANDDSEDTDLKYREEEASKGKWGDSEDCVTSSPVAKSRNAKLLPSKRKRKTLKSYRSSKARRVEKYNCESDAESDSSDCIAKGWEERTLLPNDLLLRGGNATAFRHELLSSEVVVVNYLDVYHASLKRFTNENVLHVAADLILRDKGCIPEHGWVWMHETMLTSKIATNQYFDRDAPPVSRLNAMMSSEVLLVPIQTNSSRHWSLLAIVNSKSLFHAALQVKASREMGLTKIDVLSDSSRPLAIHFDSMSQSGHSSAVKLFNKFISFCMREAWIEKNKRYYDRTRLTPNFQTFLRESLHFVQGNVVQQEDGKTCGWRAIDAVRFMAEHKNATAQWDSISKKSFASKHVEIANRTLRFMQWKSQSVVSDLPSILFPMSELLDKVCCSEFECDMNTVNRTLATFFKTKASVGRNAKRNEKKIAMAQKFESVYARVAVEMEEQGLSVRRKLRKAIKMKEEHCKTLARYHFPFPRGERYATSLYYTRYNYPDSILVCSGLNIVLQRNPRLAKEAFASSGARVLKSKRVQHQMAVFLDWTRSKARKWDTNARFRLQELVIHFVGISEAVLKSCCRQAMYVEDNAIAQGLDCNEKQRRALPQNEIESNENDEWCFEKSLTVEDGGNENGQICSSVSASILGSAISSCLTAAEQVANESIMSCVTDFEHHCKRVLQVLENVKISKVECFVTGSSMAVIPAMFKKRFKEQLMKRISSMWGHVLEESFIANSVGNAISRLLRVAERYFVRNGKLFLRISDPKINDIMSDTVLQRARKPRKKSSTNQSGGDVDSKLELEPSFKVVSDAATVRTIIERIRDVKCFGGGGQTTCMSSRNNPTPGEFLSLVFYLIQGCRAHQRNDSYHCGDLASQKWGNELPECQNLLVAVWNNFTASVRKFERDFARITGNDEDDTFEDKLLKLKFDVIVHAASKIADVTDKSALQRNHLCKSELFCYDVPASYPEKTSVRTGKKFGYCYRHGEKDSALWHGSVTDVTVEPISHGETGISISGPNALIGDFPIPKEDAPRLHRLVLSVNVECNFDFWTDTVEIESTDKSYLGFRMHECVRLVFTFHNGKQSYSHPHPVTGNYNHSFLAVITSPPTALCANVHSTSPVCVGPRKISMEVVIHDDVMQASGCRCTIQDVVNRWRAPERTESTQFSGCYVMPLEDLSLNEDIYQFNGLYMAHSLPNPFKLAFLDPSMADALHEEQRKLHYRAMRVVLSTKRADQLDFPSLEKLEKDSKEQVRAAALRCDTELNKEQVEVIQNVLCGWETKESPNDVVNFNCCRLEVKEYLRKLGTVSANDLKWWGSRSCFVQGPPGTGKTRMLAALIAVILEHVEPQLRILIVCETNKALDDIFTGVLKLFKGKGSKDRVRRSMVRIGYSNVKLVKERELHHLRGRDACDAVDKARAVFTTFGSAYRRELKGSSKAFPIVLIEESCQVKQAMAIHALTVSHCRPSVTGGDVIPVSLVCIGDSKQIHEKDYINTPVERKVKRHFFDHVFADNIVVKGSTKMVLRRQYRMNPALASYISKQFYDGKLITETEGSLPWKEDSLFRTLSRNRRFPVRNVTVVDTSMEGKNGYESLGAGRSFYNSLEVNVIVNLLRTWREDIGALEVAGKVSIITTYAKQKDELLKALNSEQMFLPVHTIDEFQGGENDIMIISLVRARFTAADDMDAFISAASAIGFVSRNERVNVALSRARQGCIVLGNVRHIARHCESLQNFFSECANKSTGEEHGTHGYYRLRYIDFKRDLRFSPFTPSYLS